ncbi:hypothetical protein SCHPADRAFT_867553 [Schizopora paradoxa]|uniref:Uncharacterized protein n=1 Tax=Schizopora paradoxa TaxID=27342 RepID=A0A0H2S134_9AGAM|nr:hypothetical protein SCHPADRAFT_867553 [Schizopora paradoxa]
MLSRLLLDTRRQWSPILRQVSSASAVVAGGAKRGQINWKKARNTKKEPGEGEFERNVKKRIQEVGNSLELPPQTPTLRDISEWKDVIKLPIAEFLLIPKPHPTGPWVLMYVLVTKIRTPTEAAVALEIVDKNLHDIPGHLQPYILILTTRIMAQLRAEPPMDHIVHTFLQLPVANNLHFNLLLRTMSRFRPSVHLAKLTTTVLDTMQARQMRLSRATYETLLLNRFVTLELTNRLQIRMARDGVKPTVKELELFLRCFGKYGAFRTASQYIAFIPPSSAFQYLRDLVDAETIHASIVQQEQRLMTPSVRGRSTKHSGPGVSGWTAALHTAARDKRVSSDGLFLLFERSKNAGLAPTLSTYTVVIRGLIKKSRDYQRSLHLWRELRSTVRYMDAAAMTVGMDVLVGSGRALEAFEVIVKHSTPDKYVSKRKQMAERDTALINALMSALEEHGWSTAVFYCWDAFHPLFGVQPDAISLTILLRAARVAERKDGSIRGLLGHIGMYNPFRSEDANSSLLAPFLSAEELEERIRACMSSSLWEGTPAGFKALELFRSVLLGNFPHLKGLRPPAKAVWSDNSNDASPLGDVARGLGLSQPKNRNSLLSCDDLPILHPQISPDERTFHAYIELLGSQRRSSEIPLTLAWMRGLDLEPRKETIGLALVLFAEVSLRGPLLETYGDISEYKRLVAWLTQWLGERKIPNEAQLRFTFRKLLGDRGGMTTVNEEPL